MPVAAVYAVSLACGALLGSTTITEYGWLIAPLCLYVLLALLYAFPRERAGYIGLAFGVGIGAAAFSWMFGALPFDWLGIPNLLISILLFSAIYVGYTTFMGLSVAAFALIIRLQAVGTRLLLLVPIAWVCSEFLRAFLLSVGGWKNGIPLNADLTFGFVGYALAWSDYLWLAQWGGVVVLSFFVALFSTAIFLITHSMIGVHFHARRRVIAGIGVVYALYIVIGFVLHDPVRFVQSPSLVEVNGLQIAPIWTDIPPALRRTDAQQSEIEHILASKIMTALDQGANVIVLPEYARYLKSEGLLNSEEALRVRDALAKHKALLIDSQRASAADGYFGQIIFYDGVQGDVVEVQNKRLLVPFGEYLPVIVTGPMRVAGYGSVVSSVERNRTFAASSDAFRTRTFEWRGEEIGVLACSEALAPFGYTAVANAGADVLINVASHSWQRGFAFIIASEVEAMARIHAVNTGKVYIQASNNSPTFVIYPN